MNKRIAKKMIKYNGRKNLTYHPHQLAKARKVAHVSEPGIARG